MTTLLYVQMLRNPLLQFVIGTYGGSITLMVVNIIEFS